MRVQGSGVMKWDTVGLQIESYRTWELEERLKRPGKGELERVCVESERESVSE